MHHPDARQCYSRSFCRPDWLISPSLGGVCEGGVWMFTQGAMNVTMDCGWGLRSFVHTFDDPAELADAIRQERAGQRDIALYVVDPHVVLAQAPLDLFLDPSNTYRLRMTN